MKLSVVMCTRNRSPLLELAIRYLDSQTVPPHEVLVVDDSDAPTFTSFSSNLYIRYLRQPIGTSLGSKLNFGINAAVGTFILKMDDDDFYGPRFIELMLGRLPPPGTKFIAFCQPYLICDLTRWQIRQADSERCSGATFLFPRSLWEAQPFRPIHSQVDGYFMIDSLGKFGQSLDLIPINVDTEFIQMRHRLGHLWTTMPNGQPMDDYFSSLKLTEHSIDTLCGETAVQTYRNLMGQK